MAPALLDGDLPVGLVPLELASEFLRRFGRGRKKKGTRVRNANKAFVCPRWTRSRRGKESVEGPADDPSRSPRVVHAARGRVGEAGPRSEQHQRATALFSGTDTSPTTIARARARYGLRSTCSTYLNNLGLRDWLDHGDSLSVWLSPSTLRLAYALCALLSLPALDPLWAAAAAGPVRAVDKTENLQGGMHRERIWDFYTHFGKEREGLFSLFLTFFPNEFSDGGLQGWPRNENKNSQKLNARLSRRRLTRTCSSSSC